MKNIHSPEELYEELDKLNKENTVTQFSVPGKGNFTLVYEKDEKTIQEEVEQDKELKKMIHESRKEYLEGRYKTTSEIIEIMYKKDSFK